MKILDFKAFCVLPAGTVFSYYDGVCNGLFRKGDTISWDGESHDFYEASILPLCHEGSTPSISATESRWGLFEEEQLFAVLEPDEIQTIGRMLDLLPTDQCEENL